MNRFCFTIERKRITLFAWRTNKKPSCKTDCSLVSYYKL